MKIFWKSYLLSLCFVVLSAGLLAGVVSVNEARRSLALLRERQRVQAQVAASEVEAGYHEQRWPFEMLSAMMQDHNVLYWRIVDGNGKTIVSHTEASPCAEELFDLPGSHNLKQPLLLSCDETDNEGWFMPLRMRTAGKPWTFCLLFDTTLVKQQVRNIVLANTLAALVIAVLLIPVLLVGTRRLLRPLASLTEAAIEIERGNYEVSLSSPSHDEIGLLISTFQAMATGIKEKDDQISKNIHQLRQAQSELVQSEKMSMLGQLVAGVAHEINTPTGAIMNVTADSMGHLRELATAAMEVLELPPEIRQWLSETIPHVLAQKTVASEIGDDSACRELERELRKQGIPEYQRIAEVMISCGLEISDPLVVRSLAEEPVLVFLEHLTSLKASSEICHASVRKITRIVKALRYYSRSGEGEMFDINVTESIDNTLVILQNNIKRIARVERNYQDSLPTVRCGSDISQVWTNIISNACYAIEGSGGKETGLIRIAATTEDNNLIVEVFNEGPPIPEDLMTKAFDPFVTTKPIGKGTGLGLSICTGILRKYDGRIEARNDAGGVTFRVSLPLAQRDAISPTRSAEKSAEPVAAEAAP